MKKAVFLILIFFIGAFAGKIYETLYYLIVNHELFNTGTRFGPWIPIYGYGAVLFSFLKYTKRNVVSTFCLSVLISGILEYTSGWFIDEFLGMQLWNYDGLLLNLNGYICFRSLVSFGIGGVILVYYVIPKLEEVMEKVKFVYIKYFTFILVLIFIVDSILSRLFKVYHLF